MSDEKAGQEQKKLLYVVTHVSLSYSCGQYHETIKLVKVFPALRLAQYYVNEIPKRDKLDYRIEEVEGEGF